ncbi:hypothetical protein K1719_001544 [Acacia pycnantha]|nr:hypothetical protein K1719_001544 [Acacia pycnantha]
MSSEILSELSLKSNRSMMLIKCGNSISCPILSSVVYKSMDSNRTLLQTKADIGALPFGYRISKPIVYVSHKKNYIRSALAVPLIQSSLSHNGRALGRPRVLENKGKGKVGKKEHHLWERRDSTQSGQKALSLIRIVSELPSEKEEKGSLIHWVLLIQVAKWMLSRGQGTTMGTYDTLLLAFDRDRRVEEAESLWNMIIHAHTRCVSKRLFSRMIVLYDHHHMPDKIIEVFADMEELRIKPDEDTVSRVA